MLNTTDWLNTSSQRRGAVESGADINPQSPFFGGGLGMLNDGCHPHHSLGGNERELYVVW